MTTQADKRGAAFLFHTDVYKWGHANLYTPGTTEIFSNYTNRGSRMPDVTKVVNFGLTGFLADLQREYYAFLASDIEGTMKYFTSVFKNIMGFEPDTSHFRELHAYGLENEWKLPIEFYSLPEGVEVPLKVPSFVFRNTDPRFAWLTNYLETWLSATVWHPSTVATISLRFRRLLQAWADKTDPGNPIVGFLGHDFSYRGLEGRAAAGAAGAANLLSFDGSDTLEAINYINNAYLGTDTTTEPLMGSVVASEHSVMCIGSAVEGEFETYKRILTNTPSGIVSLVSDTYDLWIVITGYLPKLKDLIESRDGKLVIRPDSGNPVDILTGTSLGTDRAGTPTDPNSPDVENYGTDLLAPSEKGVVELLWEIFGGTVNDAGYKVLNQSIGVIYGDSITYERANEIFTRLEAKGFASTNVVLAQGSFAFQYNTRDTFGSAVKATAAIVDGKEYPIFKDPITDSGTKKSARGYIAVFQDELNQYYAVDDLTREQFEEYNNAGLNKLKPVAIDSYKTAKFTDVRDRVRSKL